MSRTVFSDVRLVDPASGLDSPGSLVVEDGLIQAVLPSGEPSGKPSGKPSGEPSGGPSGGVLGPGLVDMAVFTGEPGSEHRETLGTAGRAAAAGGVTSVLVMPNTAPVIDDVALVEFVRQRGREAAPVHMYPSAALSVGLEGRAMTEMALLGRAGALAFTDGDRALASARLMRRVMSYAAGCGALIIQHVEEPELAGGVMHEGALATRLGLESIPAAAETIMLERDLRLVELTGARYHAAQVSTAASVEIMAAAKARGLPATCGVSVNHLVLNENDIGDYRTFLKLSPPLRTEADRAALVQGLEQGTIDVIVSGHLPQDPEAKRRPFDQAAFGAVGLETLLAASLSLVHGGVCLLRVLEALTAAPARLLGLPAGRLAPGAPADLVLFDPDAPFVVDAAALVSRCANSALDGMHLQGRVRRTVVAGRTVFEAGA